jgi:hypothetical protein
MPADLLVAFRQCPPDVPSHGLRCVRCQLLRNSGVLKPAPAGIEPLRDGREFEALKKIASLLGPLDTREPAIVAARRIAQDAVMAEPSDYRSFDVALDRVDDADDAEEAA